MPYRYTLFFTLFALVAAASCGPTAKEKAIRNTLTGVNAARESFLVWDEETQLEIVRTATSHAEGQAALDAHRERRARAVASFEAVYRLLAMAAVNPDKANLVGLLLEAQKLHTALREVRGKP